MQAESKEKNEKLNFCAVGFSRKDRAEKIKEEKRSTF